MLEGVEIESLDPTWSDGLSRSSTIAWEPDRRLRGSRRPGAFDLNLGDRDGDGIPEWKDASRESGIEGFRPTSAFVVADFDLDGDLDIYAANHMDHDFAVGGATRLAGGVNCLYINQLAETGELRFVDRASESE